MSSLTGYFWAAEICGLYLVSWDNSCRFHLQELTTRKIKQLSGMAGLHSKNIASQQLVMIQSLRGKLSLIGEEGTTPH